MSEQTKTKFSLKQFKNILIIITIVIGIFFIMNHQAPAETPQKQDCSIDYSTCSLDELKTIKNKLEDEKDKNNKAISDLDAEKKKAELNIQNLDIQLNKIEETKNKKW